MDWLTAFRDVTLPGGNEIDDLHTGTIRNTIIETGGGVYDAAGSGDGVIGSFGLTKKLRVTTAEMYDKLRSLVGKRGFLWRGRQVSSGVPLGAAFYLPFHADGGRANFTANDGTEPTTASGSIVGVQFGAFGSGAVSMVQSFTNLIKNPQGATTSGWWYYNATVAPAVVTSPTYYNCATAIQTTLKNGGYQYLGGESGGDNGALVPENSDFVTSIAVYNHSTSDKYIAMTIWQYNGTSYVSTLGNQYHTIKPGWNVVVYKSTTSAGVDNIRPILYNLSGADLQLTFSGSQVTQTSYQLPYRDGTMNGCAWTGTAHASTTIVTASKLAYADQLNDTAGTLGVIWSPADDSTAQKTAYIFDNGTLSAYFNSTDSKLYLTDNTNTISGAITFSAGDDIYACFTWGSAGLAIYVDGALLASGATYTAGANGTLYIGSDTAGASVVNGELCELVITDYAMTAAEIAAIYNAGVPLSEARIQRGIDARCVDLQATRRFDEPNHTDVALDFATIGRAWRGEVRQIVNQTLAASGNLTLTNNGDMTCKNLVVTIIATGAATVTLATGGFSMTVSATAANDELVIDCGAHTVRKNGADDYANAAFGGSNTTADWLPLAVGDNTLAVTLSGAEIEIIAQWYDTYR